MLLYVINNLSSDKLIFPFGFSKGKTVRVRDKPSHVWIKYDSVGNEMDSIEQ